MAKKVLRTQVKVNCKNCTNSFELNEDYMREREIRDGIVPLSAKSGSSTIYCDKCGSTDLLVSFNYQNVYRHRCSKCDEMFDAQETYMHKCPTCQTTYMNALAAFGA